MMGSFKANEAKYAEEASKAWGWHQMYQQAQKELSEYKSGNGKVAGGASPQSASPTAAAPGPSADPNDPFHGIDMGVYKLLAQTDGPEAAGAFLLAESMKNQASRTEAMIAEATAPFREEQERREATSRVTGQVDSSTPLRHLSAMPTGPQSSPRLAIPPQNARWAKSSDGCALKGSPRSSLSARSA
jgi:hypothetical protein